MCVCLSVCTRDMGLALSCPSSELEKLLGGGIFLSQVGITFITSKKQKSTREASQEQRDCHRSANVLSVCFEPSCGIFLVPLFLKDLVPRS